MTGLNSRPVAVLEAALALASCGEKAEPQIGSSSMIAEGDEICLRAQEEITALRERVGATPKGAVELTAGAIEIYGDEVAALRAHDAPPELDGDLDRYLASRDE